MANQDSVSGRSLILAVALGAVPAIAALFLLEEPLGTSDVLVAGSALAAFALLAWILRGRLPAVPEGWILGLALLVAALPTLAAARVLDASITNDERAYLYQAELFAEGRLTEPLPPQPELYLQPQIFRDAARGIRYAKYPPGTSLSLLPGVAAGWPLLSTLLAGLLDVLLVAAIARRLGLASPALAALLLALSPFFLLVQTSSQSEVYALPAVLAGYWALLRLRTESGSPRGAAALGALAGACSGFVFLGRPITGLLLAAALGLGMMSAPRRVAAVLGAVAGGLPFAAAMLLYNQAITGDAFLIPYHQYAVTFGPFQNGEPVDVYGKGDFAQGLLDQAGRWSAAFAGILGAAALGFWGLWRLRARDGGAALLFAVLGPLAYSFHWYQGHKAYLGPLYCYESLGFLLCGALLVLQAAPQRARHAFALAAICAGPAAVAFRFGEIREASDLRSAPQRAAREAPPGAVILYPRGLRSPQDNLTVKYYTPSRPPRNASDRVFIHEPRDQALGPALQQAGLSGRPVFRFVPDADLRNGHLEPVNPP